MRILTAAVAALMGSTLGGAEAVPASVRGEAPLVFEANWGQLDPEVAYASRADGYEVLLDSAGARLVLTPEAGRAGAFLKFSFRDASPFATPIGIEELRGRVSYLAGADAASWTSGIPTFAAVTRTEIYPFVDLTYRGEGRGLRIELVLLPGADEESIRLTVEGTDSLGIDASTEDLVASVAGAEIRFLRPEASQTLPGGRSRDAGSWVITGPQEVGVVSPRHDPASPLVLSVPVAVPREIRQPTFADPVRIATDAAGNAYVTGRVATLPGEKAGAYVTKIAPDGKTRLFTTYFGGEGTDVPLGIAVDAGGEAVITGRTSSAAFPLVHPLASSLLGATDAFVARLAPDGGSFVYSTYLGGEGDDEGTAIDLDAEGTAWVTGRTSGEGLSVGIDAAQSVAAGGWDAFVAGLSPNGSRLTAATLAGGSGDDEGSAIRVGRDGTVYVAGSTDSADFPVIAALQSTLADGRGSGAGDAFVTAMDPVTGRFLFATYLGGAGEDTATGLGLDGEGNLHVAGRTTSPDLPPGGTPGAPGRYVATLSPGGTELRQVSRLAATPEDAGDGFAIDDSGDFWIAGGGALASKRSPDGRVLDRIGGPMPGGTRVT
ncbi:MAG TPA: SBBP repeat-containing protein, partial [Candidatus Saccharimonadales bacterium]|nr:SBBP repeat-containing protein [Candidatus Saccharimonadales bacterium]